MNADVTVAAGSTVTGISGTVITGPEASAADNVLLISIVPSPNNGVGAYCNWLVKLNLNQYSNAALGIS
jgi:hypothetical protein